MFHCNEALGSEIHAMMQGMALAIQHTDEPVLIQSDSSELALSILSRNMLTRSAYGHLAAKINALMEVREFVPQKISREQNRVADRTANYSRT